MMHAGVAHGIELELKGQCQPGSNGDRLHARLCNALEHSRRSLPDGLAKADPGRNWEGHLAG